MEQLQTINFRPLVDSQAELAPYLAGLNVSEALQDFGRLADLVLSSEENSPVAADQYQYHQQQKLYPTAFDDQQQAMMATSGCANSVYSYLHEPESGSTSPSSPGGASLYSSATTSGSAVGSHFWSQASSPLSIDHSFSCSSSSFSSPSRSHYSSSSASSSTYGDLDEASAHSPSSSVSASARRNSSRSSSSSSASRSPIQKGDRKRQNATAAERYRRKLKGSKCGLDEQLDLERARNLKLMQSFEAKLELYREFADLLATNTRDPNQDLALAQLGSSSLDNILERVCPASFLASNERHRVELERLQAHFKRVLSLAPFCHQQQRV